MCGIFGFATATDQPSSVVVEGLKDLEYRGYDSWGLAISREGKTVTEKSVGKIGDAVSSLPASRSSLGHTRWATHGRVTQGNAHPHMDCKERLAVIHNGIVENHAELRASLNGHTFRSETDTEVVVHMIEDELAQANGNSSVVRALMSSFKRLSGLSAVAVLDGETGEIAAVKNGSPLVVGLAEAGCFLASDPAALLPHTRDLIFVEDGQAVRLLPSGPQIFDVETESQLEPQVKTVSWVSHGRDLGPFAHYMIKEINEQPQVLRRLAANTQAQVAELAGLLAPADNIFVTGCGTANNAGLAAQHFFSRVARRQVGAVMASEMSVVEPALGPGSIVIALSQSGETIDVLDAARLARDRGARVVALTNSEGSSLYRMADMSILLACGPERCVLATKTYTAKLAVLLMTAYALRGEAEAGRRHVAEAAIVMEAQLMEEEKGMGLQRIADAVAGCPSMFVLGRGGGYPLALEAALKVKEVSYIHAEGFAAGELKHGVIALIEDGTPCLFIAGDPSVLKETLAAAAEVKARGARTIGFSHFDHAELDMRVPLHGTGEATSFEVAVGFQLLAYHLALALGRDPDKPRNLAKSVTVR
jgi:glucosamine--fructose-6-phosphate aminotransferase (isomerizing)